MSSIRMFVKKIQYQFYFYDNAYFFFMVSFVIHILNLVF